MSSEPIPANPSNGNNANIGEGSILRDKTIGCLVTSSQVTTFSSMHGFPLKGTASPDDPSLKDYWRKRNARKVTDLPASRQKIAKKQNGVCPVCKNTLFNDEELHVHHKVPKAKGGKDNYGNLVLVRSEERRVGKECRARGAAEH